MTTPLKDRPRIIYKWGYPPLPELPVTSSLAVLTIATGKRGREMLNRWGKTSEAYAKDVRADWVVVTETANPEYRYLDKLVIGPLLEKYERVAYFDADVEILPGAVNLFDLVPDNFMGLIDERMYYHHECIERGIERVVDIGKDYKYSFYPPGRYMSSGMMVVSKMHRNVFELPEFPFIRQTTYEQELLFARILHYDYRAMYFGPELQYVHGFGKHEMEHAKFRHHAGVVPYEDQ